MAQVGRANQHHLLDQEIPEDQEILVFLQFLDLRLVLQVLLAQVSLYLLLILQGLVGLTAQQSLAFQHCQVNLDHLLYLAGQGHQAVH